MANNNQAPPPDGNLVDSIIGGVQDTLQAQRDAAEQERIDQQQAAAANLAKADLKAEVIETIIDESAQVFGFLKANGAIDDETIWPFMSYTTQIYRTGKGSGHTERVSPDHPQYGSAELTFYRYSGLAMDATHGLVWYEHFSAKPLEAKSADLATELRDQVYPVGGTAKVQGRASAPVPDTTLDSPSSGNIDDKITELGSHVGDDQKKLKEMGLDFDEETLNMFRSQLKTLAEHLLLKDAATHPLPVQFAGIDKSDDYRAMMEGN